tara:strand:+ start:1518 stop:2486 length:969 start_codon:yes stop_codon:yes gene_type:complete
MTVLFKRQSESWSKHSSFPSNTASVTYAVYDDDDDPLTTDDAIDAASGALLIGGQLSSPGVGPSVRPLFCKDVTWSQTTPTLVTAVAKYDSTLFIPSDYDEDTVQSVEEDVAGYVNTALNATTYGVAWWRYKSPSAWESAGSTYPWTTSTPSAAHQVLLLNVADSDKVDAGGTPLKRPILGQQLTVSLTFETKPTALRAEWRSLRGLRNNAAFLGDAIGEWLFTGANQRASTNDTLYAVELTFYRDPFGFCRQRAEAGPNGVFRKDIELEEITNPSATICGDGTDTMLVASCVDWVQLHPELGDFSDLFTAAQLAQVVELIA